MGYERRMIDAIALISKARRMETTDNNGIPVDTFAVPVMAIEDAPTVDAMEVVHGRWTEAEDGDGAVCSVCGEDFCNVYLEVERFLYCPNCGAKMDLKG